MTTASTTAPAAPAVREIETARLLLRVPVATDVRALAPIYADARTMRWVADGRPRTHPETDAAVRRMIEAHRRDGYGLWTAVLRDTGDVVGRCGLVDWTLGGRPETEVAYLLGRQWWGSGLATEAAIAARDVAFDRLGRARLASVVHPANGASIRVAQKIGMRAVGRMRLFGAQVGVWVVARPPAA